MLTTTLIEIPAWGDASLIELVWMTSGMLATAFAVGGVPAAWRLRTAAIKIMDPVIALQAGGYLRRELIRIVQGVGIAFIGVYAAVEPPPIPGPVYVTPIGLVLTAVLLIVGLLNAAQSALDRRQQWRIKHLLEI